MRLKQYLNERKIGKTNINYYVTKLPIGRPGKYKEVKFIMVSTIETREGEERKGYATKAFMDVINKYHKKVDYVIFSTLSKKGKMFVESLVKKGILEPIETTPTGWTNKYRIHRK